MKILAVPKHLSGAVAPLVTLKYLVGLRSFEYSRGKLCIVPSLLYLMLILSIFSMSILWQHNFLQHIKLLKFEYVLDELMHYMGAIIITYEMILGYFYTKAVNACYRKISQMDETLQRLGSIINYGEIYFLSISAVVFWFLYILYAAISATIQLRADLSTQIWIIVAQVYAISISFSITFEFSILVRYLQTRFKLVNRLLSKGAAVSTTERMKLNLLATEDYNKITDREQCQNILSIKVLSQLNRQLQSRIRTSISGRRNFIRTRGRSRLPSQIQKHFKIKLQGESRNQFKDSILVRKSIMIAECRKRTHLLQTIRQVHLELCRVLKTLCTSFGIQITLEIGISIIFTTELLYNLYIQLCEQRTTGHILIDRSYNVIIFITINVLKIVLINRVCKHATNEGKKTNEIIREIYGCPDINTREEIQQFDLQTSQNPVQFVTFGIFLNYEFLSSCLKTVTTYLVIMIQMNISPESDKNS